MSYSDYKKLQEQYEAQKRIEEYQRTRILSVPKTRKADVVLFVFIYLFLVLAIVFLFIILPLNVWLKISLGSAVSITLSEFYFRFLGIEAVKCYQHYAEEETRRRCLCVPSCSEYAILCFKKYEFIQAIIKIRKRLFVTCRGGDFVLDYPK